ncbi:class I SAM-dependent DNA methyltransferase [Sporohalobacter salinus]|uniref:class I SAM-dependent DNA methyltransferase n=1 Tax=Sporohalobacter salinus TaxID=1494606 RepID=UPI0019613863|nr:class I SAM-dependent methyltransferase [Sporohalobacter salinus]MBM7624728.1 ubiquinone/menaquinone biosynthesis C-methylase UbiE [Sporohalobacter salinus]
MNFYKEFSDYYDNIFQTKNNKVEFLVDNVKDKGQILDVATGTGNYAIALGKKGYSVRGLDLSKAMINQALNKIKDKELDVKFKVEDMKNLTNIYKQQNFNLIYCIGNSLVHLENEQEIKDVLNQAYSLLKNKGKLIIQIVNYDRILTKNITSLPTINNEEKQVKLVRNYALEDEKVNFKTKLITPQGQFENSVLLYPLKSGQLREMLNAIGFAEVNLYGDFNYNDYKAYNSFPLIAVAIK